MAEGVVVAFVLLAVVAPLVLYRLVRAEHEDRTVMDRAAAERRARRDVDDDERR
jgi:multisubunit Na+/H+ antiporter MnhG subunit